MLTRSSVLAFRNFEVPFLVVLYPVPSNRAVDEFAFHRVVDHLAARRAPFANACSVTTPVSGAKDPLVMVTAFGPGFSVPLRFVPSQLNATADFSSRLRRMAIRHRQYCLYKS